MLYTIIRGLSPLTKHRFSGSSSYLSSAVKATATPLRRFRLMASVRPSMSPRSTARSTRLETLSGDGIGMRVDKTERTRCCEKRLRPHVQEIPREKQEWCQKL